MKNADAPFLPMPDRLKEIILEHRLSNRQLAEMGDYLAKRGSKARVGDVVLNGDHVLSIIAELTWRRIEQPDFPPKVAP